MKRRTFFTTLVSTIIIGTSGYWGYQSYQINTRTNENELFLMQIEALAKDESNMEFRCKGNTGDCAKGKDEETGHDFIIHGELTKI